MGMVRKTSAKRSAGVSRDLSDLVRTLAHAFSDTYRPELHYMRGPGPKWRAKHDPAPVERHAAASLVHVDA